MIGEKNRMMKRIIHTAAAAACAVMLLCIRQPVSVQAKNIMDNGDFKFMISEDGALLPR